MSVDTASTVSRPDGSMREKSRTMRLRAWRSVLVVAAAFGVGGAVAPAAQAELLSTFEAESRSTQAGAHADARTNFVVTDFVNDPVKTLKFHLPVGLMGSIGGIAECPTSTYFAQGGVCPPETQVGEGFALMNVGSPESPFVVPWPVKAFVLTPGRGDTALIGASPGQLPARPLIRVNVRPGDYGLDATIDALPNVVSGTDLTLWGVPWDHWDPATQARNPRRPFMSNPSTCGNEDVTTLEVDSYKNPGVWEAYSQTHPAQTGCDLLNFEPEISTKVDSPFTSGPSGLEFGIKVPQNDDPDGLATPPLRNVTAVLPEGVTINPSLAGGLDACTDAAFGQGSNEQSTCPASAKIGSAEIEVPALKDPHVEGSVYTGQPLPGNKYRLFLEAYGSSVRVKLKGTVRLDPVTGQITTSFVDNPQAPVSSIKLAIKGGPRGGLVMPDTCGSKRTTASLESWPGQTANPLAVFDVAFDGSGSACPAGLGFNPTFTGGVENPVAGDSSPFSLTVARTDRDQQLKAVKEVVLPAGLLGDIGSVPRCADAQAAAGTCPEASRVGRVEVFAGAGSLPLKVPQPGKAPTGVYLTGPYKGAPFGLSIKVPAQAGPFDLGTVVVRGALHVDPNDAHVTVLTDELPTILDGIPLRMRSVSVVMDRPGFMLNPTSCAVKSIAGTLGSVSGQSVDVSSRFQVGGCADLDYAPKLDLAVSGQLKNGGHPQLSAKLTAKKGEANQRKAQVTLPLNLALDPKNAKALCEPSQVPTNSCPAGSIVGSAKAVSILDVPLEGPVYFVRGERTTATGRVVATLPKLFIPLKGQGVTVNLHASSDVVDRKLQTTFDNLPDAPIEAFDLRINGGANGILKVSNGDVCKSTVTPKVGQAFVGQNGKVFRATSTLGASCKFGVVKAARSGNRVTVTASGLSSGKLTVSGLGVSRSSRSVGAGTTVASVGVSLNAATQRAVKRGRTVRLKLKVSFDPSAKGKKTVSKTTSVVVKPAKKKK